MLQTLFRLINKGIQKFPANPMFLKLRSAVEGAMDVPTLTELFVSMSESPVPGEMTSQFDISPAADADRRVRVLAMKGIKAYPDTDGVYYGLHFCNIATGRDSRPISSVILGNNGSGKTSLYCSLEFLATRYSNIAALHGLYYPDDQKVFLQNMKSDNPFDIRMLDAGDNSHKYPGMTYELCTPAFFSSQYDIQEFRSDGITREYIYTQLGRYKLLELSDNLSELCNVTEILNQIYRHKEKIKVLKSKEKIKELTDTIRALRVNAKDRLGIYRGGIASEKWADNGAYRHIHEMTQFFNSEVNASFNQYKSVAEEIVPKLFNPYLTEDNLVVELRQPYDNLEPVLISSDGEIFQPNIYLNTYRLKILTLVLKISFAFAAKIIDNLNFPIVIDDMFDASDFNSKDGIRNFFRTIMQLHDSHPVLSLMPLQLIILTQDQLVGENLYEGIVRASSPYDVKYMRLIDHRETDNTDERTMECSNEERITYRNITVDICSAAI